MITRFTFSFSLFTWWITLTDFCMLIQPYNSGMTTTLVTLSWDLILNYKWTWLNQSLIMSYTDSNQLDQEALRIL